MIRQNHPAKIPKTMSLGGVIFFIGLALFSPETRAQYTDLSSAYDKLVQNIVVISGTNEVVKNQGLNEVTDSVKKMINDSLTSEVLNDTAEKHRANFATYYYAVVCGDMEYAVSNKGARDYIKKRIVMIMNSYPVADDTNYNETEENAIAFCLGLSYAVEPDFTKSVLEEKIKGLNAHKDFLYSMYKYIQAGGLAAEPKSKMEQSVLLTFVKMSKWATENTKVPGK